MSKFSKRCPKFFSPASPGNFILFYFYLFYLLIFDVFSRFFKIDRTSQQDKNSPIITYATNMAEKRQFNQIHLQE